MADEMFRIVWTKPSGLTIASEPVPREQALTEFDNCREIRHASDKGHRLRVMRDSDYRQLTST